MSDNKEKLVEIPWLTISEAAELSAATQKRIPERTIRWAALHNFIPGAMKRGRDWQIPRVSFLHWLGHRPKPGRKVMDDGGKHAPI